MSDSPLDSPVDPAPAEGSGDTPLRQEAIRGASLLSVRQLLVGLVTVGGIVGLPLLLTPAEFSLYGYVNTVVLVGAAVGDLGLGAYIISNAIRDRDLERSFALQLTFWIFASALLIGTSLIGDPFGFSPVTTGLLVFCLLLFSLQALPTALLEKRMRFARISAIEIVQRVILVGIALVLAAFHPTEWSIPLAAAIAAVVGYPAFLFATRWRWRPRWGGGEPVFRGFASHWWQVRIATQSAYAAYPLLGGLLFSATEVGLIVWALAVTSVPAYFAPMVARATFPALARAEPLDRGHIFSPLLRGLLVIGMPLIAALLVAAEPLTEGIFGAQWTDAVPLLRLESITTMLGIATSSALPFAFLTASPRTVKWISVGNTLAIVVLGVALAPAFGYLSISIATIVSTSVELILFDRLLRRRVGYGLIGDMGPAVAGLALAVIPGAALLSLTGSTLPGGILAGAVVAAVQVAVTYQLGGGINPRAVLGQMRGGSGNSVTAS